MPAWAVENPRLYWSSADQYERKNGRLYKGLEFSLPKELTASVEGEDPWRRAEMRNVATAMAARICERYAMTPSGKRLPYTFAIHTDQRDFWHVHLMISERVNDGLDRDPELWFRRAATGKNQTPAQGGAKKTKELYPKEWLLWVRRYYQARVNLALRSVRVREKIDMRSYQEQGITDKIPQLKKSFAASRAEKRGYFNTRWHLRQELQKIRQQIAELQTQIDEECERSAMFVGPEVEIRPFEIKELTARSRRRNGKKIIEYKDQENQVVIVDAPGRVSVVRPDDDYYLYCALWIAWQKWKKVQVQGTKEFENSIVDLAVERNIPLENTDLMIEIERRLADQAERKKITGRGGQVESNFDENYSLDDYFNEAKKNGWCIVEKNDGITHVGIIDLVTEKKIVLLDNDTNEAVVYDRQKVEQQAVQLGIDLATTEYLGVTVGPTGEYEIFVPTREETMTSVDEIHHGGRDD